MKILLGFLCLLWLVACDLPETDHTIEMATIKKVYTTVDDGHTYHAYVIDRDGTEVVVTGASAEETFNVGDKIQYLAQKMEMDALGKTLSFTLMGAADEEESVPEKSEQEL